MHHPRDRSSQLRSVRAPSFRGTRDLKFSAAEQAAIRDAEAAFGHQSRPAPLVVPHLARSLVGPDFARLMPAAAILGGGYLLLIDTLARTAAQVEIPLGILTAVVGTPFFIWLLAHLQRNWS